MAKAKPIEPNASSIVNQPCAAALLQDADNEFAATSVAALQQCALKACETCAQFLQFFQIIFGCDDLPNDLSFRKQNPQLSTSSQVWSIIPKPYGHHVEGIEITLQPGGFSDTSTRRGEQRYIGWTGDEGAIALAKYWMDDCINRHPDCERYEPSALPDRVLDVSGGDVRLYETKNQKAPYISLSHCWGKTKAACTTFTHNIEAQKQGILWGTFPQTFKDAIQVTRALNVRYLWVDNVCIIQDSFEDWEQQAVQMASIYSRSYITIAATASTSDDAGCFRIATNDSIGHMISVPKDSSTGLDIWVRAQMQTHWLASPNEMMAEAYFGTLGDDGSPPLFGRSWCFQERMLSSRLLRFDEWEISWSCRHTETCSCGYLQKVVGPARNENPLSYTSASGFQGSESIDATKVWQEIVNEYGRLALTYARDKLPAIAALAERHGDLLRKEDVYLAGLWSGSLINDMAWLAYGNRESNSRLQSQSWHAPTWSWASSNVSILYFGARKEAIAQVVEIHCEPVVKAPFSRFHEGAYIVLSGTALSGRILDSDDPGSVELSITKRYTAMENWNRLSWASVDVPLSEIAGQQVELLHLARDKDPRLNSSGDYWIILRNLSLEEETEKFERVGIFQSELVPDVGLQEWPRKVVKIL